MFRMNNLLTDLPVFKEPDPEPSSYTDEEDYSVLNVISMGSYSKVDLVRHLKTNKTYALKIQSKKFIEDEQDGMHFVKREVALLKSMDSPFIVKLVAGFQTQNIVYLVLDGVSGRNLQSYIEDHKHMNPDQVIFYMAELFLGMEYLHNRDIIHRDLRLECLNLGNDGHLRICDLRWAKGGVTDDTTCYSMCMQIEYMPPECFHKNGYRKALDWWSYGLILLELLGQNHPFRRKTGNETKYAIEKGNAKDLPWLRCSNAVRHLLEHLLVCEEKRYKADQIHNHIYFKHLNWKGIMNHSIKPPIKNFRVRPVLNSSLPQHVFPDYEAPDAKPNPFKDFDYDPNSQPSGEESSQSS